MKPFIVTLIIFFSYLYGTYSIVYVHIGEKIPSYAFTALSQARLFNPEAQIFLVAKSTALLSYEENLKAEDVQTYQYDQHKLSQEHIDYQKYCKTNPGFWRYTSERFLYLWDLINNLDLENVFHLENDNMLYVNLNQMLSLFQENYPGIGVTIDNDDRCIPGFVWISNKSSMKKLADYFLLHASTGLNDMQVLGKYKKYECCLNVDSLPIIMEEYKHYYALKTPSGLKTKKTAAYYNNINMFNGIFDAAAIGQYLGGIDPIHKNSAPGFLNESCIFRCDRLKFIWEKDQQNRKIPFAVFLDKKYPIFNLHIHSKRLKDFRS